MPAPRRSNLSRRTRRNQSAQIYRANLTPEQRAQIQETERVRIATARARESEEEPVQRLADMRTIARSAGNRTTEANRAASQLLNRTRAFEYDSEIEYCTHRKIQIGDMDKECNHCHALKFKNETVGMFCASGKVVLPQLNPPPEPLQSLMSGESAQSKLF